MTRRWIAAVVVAQALYLVIVAANGRFVSGDEIAYKAAGREWARSGNFIAPELAGFVHWAGSGVVTRGYAPPVYTFLFGVYVRAFGLSVRTNALFDALIHILLGWAVFALTRAFDRSLSPGWAAAAAIATLPLGTSGRPDELGLAFALFGASVLWGKDPLPRRVIAAGTLYGLATATSLAASALASLIALVAILTAARPWGERIGRVLLLGVVTALLFVVAMTPLTIAFPEGPRQILHLASTAAKMRWIESVLLPWHYAKEHVFAVLAAVPAFFFARRGTRGLWLAPGAAIVAVLLLLPAKGYYWWLCGPALLAAAAVTIARTPFRAVAAVATLALLAVASTRFLLLNAILSTLPASQRLEPNLALVRRTIPPGATVMLYDYWPALANEYRTFDTEASPGWERVDYIVLTGNGSGRVGQPQSFEAPVDAVIRQRFQVVSDHLNREPFRLGAFHTSSAWGWGPLILKRVR